MKGERLGSLNLKVEEHPVSMRELPQQHTTFLTGSRLRDPQCSRRWTFGTVAASRAVGAVASVHAAAKAGEPRNACPLGGLHGTGRGAAAARCRARAPDRAVAWRGSGAVTVREQNGAGVHCIPASSARRC